MSTFTWTGGFRTRPSDPEVAGKAAPNEAVWAGSGPYEQKNGSDHLR